MTILWQKIRRIGENSYFVAVKKALTQMVPIIVLGAFCLALRSIPNDAYQELIQTVAGGAIYKILSGIYNATFQLMSVYMSFCLSYQMIVEKNIVRTEERCGLIMTSMSVFFILVGMPMKETEVLGPKGMFTAIVAVLSAVALYTVLDKVIRKWRKESRGGQARMEMDLQFVVPTIATVFFFVIINYVVTKAFHVESIYSLFFRGITIIFNHITDPIASSLLFVVSSSFLWFMGVHGSDMLEGAVDVAFSPISETSHAILTRPFLDNFILMGGCGTTVCLLLAVLLFTKKGNAKKVGRIAVIPAIFNINEVIVYGLPVILNSFLIIPFLLVPLICFATTYFSMWIGWVPAPMNEVGWTTPVIASGYLTTGAVSGSVLQVVNIFIGTLIYYPFVKAYEKAESMKFPKDYEKILGMLRLAEEKGVTISLSDNLSLALTVETLILDLKDAMEKNELTLFYQPQICENGDCFGAEALLRWEHKDLGSIYPPMIIQLALEGGFLQKLERWVFHRALEDAKLIEKNDTLRNTKISMNVTAYSIQDEKFIDFLLKLAKKHPTDGVQLCIEITEQAAIQLNDLMRERFASLRKAGYSLAVDDFSMGSTSIKYLNGNSFNTIKLDGFLVKEMMTNDRCYEIISHIMSLSRTLGVEIIAEYVSDKSVQEKLLSTGCTIYQGWYYSKPITKEEYILKYGNSRNNMVK